MPRRRVTGRNPGGQPNQDPVAMGSKSFEVMISQRVADALANFENNRNARSDQGGNKEDSTQGGNGYHQWACTYKELMNCKPKPFYGKEGVVGLTCWIEKMESVFEISLCTENYKVKFSACTFEDIP